MILLLVVIYHHAISNKLRFMYVAIKMASVCVIKKISDEVSRAKKIHTL